MAATGLLGINPYGKGVALDISSKPVAFAIQQQQKEQAKRDALEKYFMDYEKSINPAGVRKIEGDEFMKQLADYKSYFLQNRDKILNPAKYGYDAQSEATAKLKGMVNLIDQSKKAAAEDKAFKTYIDSVHRSGKKYDLGQLSQILNSSNQLATSNAYQAPDASLLNIYDPYNAGKVAEEINRLRRTEELPTLAPSKREGFLIQTTRKPVVTEEKAAYAVGKLADQGWKEELLDMASHPEEYEQLNKAYQSIPGNANKTLSKTDLNALSRAHVERLASPIQDTKEVEDKLYWFNKAEAGKNKRALLRGSQQQDQLDFLRKGIGVLNTGDESQMNQYFAPWTAQGKLTIGGKQIGFKNFKRLPDGNVEVNYNQDVNGVAIPQKIVINPKSDDILPKLISLHQNFLGSNVKLEGSIVKPSAVTPIKTPRHNMK